MRLTHPRSRAVGRPVAFRFDGVARTAMEGETIAAALAAAGVLALRRTASGASRGVHCGIGACWDCLVTVDGRGGQRACLTKVVHGMDVSGDPAAGTAPLAARPAGPTPERTCDVLVVGGGPAGLAAAIASAEAGASVVLLDERDAPGGQYAKPLAASHAHVLADAQHRIGLDLVARAHAAGVTMEPGAAVWAAFAPDEVAALVRGSAVAYRPRALVLAAGAHEAPVAVPGWTLPGVMTTGGVQGLVRSHRVAPGQRVLIAGSGPLNLQLACELLTAGARVVAVVEAAARPGWTAARDLARMATAAPDLCRDGAVYLARLALARVPVLWASRVRAFEGGAAVQAAIVSGPRGTRRLLADAVAVNQGFVPETGLARSLGATHRVEAGRLETATDAEGRTSVAGVFAVGDGAALGGARVALARGRIAGLAAARDLGFAASRDAASERALAAAAAFQRSLWRVFAAAPPGSPADDTIVCRCEEVTAGRLRAELPDAASLPALKRATRAGMGRCQGRFCATTVLRLCSSLPLEEAALAAPRPPLRPVPAAALMVEAPEFAAPLVERPAPPVWLAPFPPAPTAAERRCDIAVIGAGAVGLATALSLARDGADVLVLDRAAPGLAASTANAGSLHAQLLAYDVDPDDPTRETPAVHALPLGPAAIALWRGIAAEAGEGLGLSLGGLMVAGSETAMRRLRAKATVEARYHVETHVVGPAEAGAMMPAAAPMRGAVFCPGEGRIDPLRATLALLRLATAAGARVLAGLEVRSLERAGAGWRIGTPHGPVIAGQVVICAGAYSANIAALADVALPVRGTVQQVIVTEPAPPLVRHLVAVADRHLSLKQQDNGSLLIGGGWFGRYDRADGTTRPERRSIEGNLWVAGGVLPGLAGLHVVRAWTGLAPSVDGAPILGEIPGRPGLFVAAGANGLTLAPILGRLTAEAMRRGVAPDPRLSLERFA